MASIDYIRKRIDGKRKEIEKLRKKMERILAAKASGWEKNPYWYREDDIRYTQRDIDEAEKSLAKYEEDLQLEIKKRENRNIPAITVFLDRWLSRNMEYYSQGLKEAFLIKDRVRMLYEESTKYKWGSPEYEYAEQKYKDADKEYKQKLYGYYKEVTSTDRNGRKCTNSVKERSGELEYINHYMERTYEESMAKVEKDLKREYDRKYDFIIEETCRFVGKITDATRLRIGAKGDLNGYIEGTDGTAKVQTIEAGGWNIQCYHFRTLITLVK